MSVRTPEELSDRVAEDLIWRKKELTALKDLAERAVPTRRPALLRALVALLYAHWEGFVKNTSQRYLEYLANRRLAYEDLSSNFVALAIHKQVREAAVQRNPSTLIATVELIRSGLATRSRISAADSIDTESNLSSTVLREVMTSLGLDYRHFESKEWLLDERLLANRNRIAHGEYLPIDSDAAMELADEVQGMMEQFRTLVENAVVLGQYRYARPAS